MLAFFARHRFVGATIILLLALTSLIEGGAVNRRLDRATRKKYNRSLDKGGWRML